MSFDLDEDHGEFQQVCRAFVAGRLTRNYRV